MGLIREILHDIAQGKNIENYFVIIIGIVLIVVEFFGDIPTGWQLTALLMGTTLLVFKTREGQAAAVGAATTWARPRSTWTACSRTARASGPSANSSTAGGRCTSTGRRP